MFLRAKENVYGIFTGMAVCSSLKFCRITKIEDEICPFSFTHSKGKRWEFQVKGMVSTEGLVTQLTLLLRFYSEDPQVQEGSSDPRWLLSPQVQAHFCPHPFVSQLPSPVPSFPHWRLKPTGWGHGNYNCRKFHKIGISSLTEGWLYCCKKRSSSAKTWIYCLSFSPGYSWVTSEGGKVFF